VRSSADALLVSEDLDLDNGQDDRLGTECMAVGVPWLEFQSGLGSGVQDLGFDVGKSNDNKGETASESARLVPSFSS